MDEKNAVPVSESVSSQEESVHYPLSGKKVMLDSGHGGYDDGSVGKHGIKEKDITLAITLKLRDLLEQDGAEVFLTRDSDEVSWPSDNGRDLRKRSMMANDSQADCFVSVHTNFSDVAASEISGSEIWLSYEDERNIALAEAVNEALIEADYTKSRGLKDHKESFLSLLYYNEIPSILVETAFLSNDEDYAVLVDEQGQQRIADALAQGIKAYLLSGEDR